MSICDFTYKGKDKIRLDVVLAKRLQITRSQVKTLARLILVNGKPCKSAYKLKNGDIIHFKYEKRILPSVSPENIAIDILYEDENVIVLNKQTEIVVHPSFSSPSSTLLNALNYYRLHESIIKDEFSQFIQKEQIKDISILYKYALLKGIPTSELDILRLGIVHRLDKATSGLIITARNFSTQMFLKEEFRNRHVKKFYITILAGIPIQKEGIIKTSIFRSKKDGRKFASSSNLRKGRIAVSYYKVLKTFGRHSLVKFRIYTGRTHQIRVHAKHIGCPLFSDEVYGKKVDGFNLFLHCYKLEIDIAKGVHKVFKVPIPKKFKKMLKTLKKNSLNKNMEH